MIPVIFICGPTAVGKTKYAIKLAKDLDAEIVSADSMQIYKYMNIGSAKPSKEEQKEAVHHLIDFVDPKAGFTASDYQKIALNTIKEIDSRGKKVIVSGGTGLYINSLIYDMDYSAPQGDDAYRKKIFEEEQGNTKALWERLLALDPNAETQMHPNNIKRVLRAIERLEKGEESLHPFAKKTESSKIIEPILIGLNRDRTRLYERIDQRVEQLFEMGLEEEIKALLEKGLTIDDISMKGIGYKEIIEALSLGLPGISAKEKIKENTRHYAKRQLTWLRRYETMEWFFLNEEDFDQKAYENILNYIANQQGTS